MNEYLPEVIELLAGHGIRPNPTTPPELVRSYLNDLYRYEIRRLKARLLDGQFEKREYKGRVMQLRTKYPLLSIPIRLWMR